MGVGGCVEIIFFCPSVSCLVSYIIHIISGFPELKQAQFKAVIILCGPDLRQIKEWFLLALFTDFEAERDHCVCVIGAPE